MKPRRAPLSRAVLVATALAAAAMLPVHGCSQPCGDSGLPCCNEDQCVDSLVCNAGTCALPVGRDAGVAADAGCGALGLPCCGGACAALLVCGAGDRCLVPSDLGVGCARNSECDERLCLPVDASAGRNVCTTGCSDGGVCPAGWLCGPYPGVPLRICLCSAAPEVCNGLDDDCDGVVDGPAAQEACAASDAGTCVDAGCFP